MSPEPIVTEEELARTETILEDWLAADPHALWLVLRLIAALRAKNQQITNLRASLNERNAEVQALKEKLGPI